MKKLLAYLKNYKKEVILGPVFKLAEAVFELIVPLVMASIIDVGVKNADSGYVLRMGGVLIALSATGLVCALVCQYFAAKASQGFGTELRNKLFAHIGGFSHAEADKFGPSTLTTRLTNDVNQLQLAVAMFIRLAIRAPFLVIGAAVMAFVIDAKLALIFVAAAGAIALALYFIMTKSLPLFGAAQKLLDRVSLLSRENLGGTRVIRAFSRQKDEAAEFGAAGEDLLRVSTRVGRISALLNPLTYLIVNIGIVAILWFGGGAVDTGALEQGQIVALVNYMTQILLAMVVVANLIVLFGRAGASAKRVNEVLDTAPSVTDGAGARAKAGPGVPVVEFRGVSFSYAPDAEDELSAVDLKILRGEAVGVIGGTGAGKSTLVSLIPRFYDATAGSVMVDGEDVRQYTLSGLRKKIGFVPQRAALFSGTLAENMRWADEDATDEEIWAALRAAQAAEFVEKWKDGLDTRILQGGRNLSGGQRQRLTIARALVGDPELLILDDASSALDFATDAALRRAVSGIGGLTVITVSQRVGAIKNSDKIVVLDDGAVSGVGTHAELFDTNDVYREIVLSQTE